MTERDIFLALLDLPGPTERSAFLTRACAGDTALRERVERLLDSHDNAGSFLGTPAVTPVGSLEGDKVRGEAVPPDDGATQDLATQATAPAPLPDGEGRTADADRAAAASSDLSFLAASTRPDALGRLGHYEVLEVLGNGGFGIVFRAFDETLQRVVAIKVLAPELAVNSPARKRFLREARSSAKVRHENVVQVYAVEEEPLPYLVMEFVPGQTLQDRLDRAGPLEVPDIVRLGRQIAEGLAAAHATGLIHRDVKPANILIEAGPHPHVKITDFGLARAADDASLSLSGVISGTPMYMAPEQASADTLDHRADLFSLGSVLYAMCTGRPPFRAPSTLAVLKRVAEDTPRPIREIVPEVPPWLCDLIAKLHAKKPDERFATAGEVAELLGRGPDALPRPGQAPVVQTMPPRQTPEAGPTKRSQFRAGRWAAAAAVLLLLGGLGFTEGTGVTDVRGTVIRLFSPEGTLVVEVDDPGVSVKIDGPDLVITGAGAKEIRLKAGQYKLEASKDGKVVSQELVSVTSNGRQIVRISQEPITVPKTAADNKDPDRRAAEYVLSIGGQVEVNGEGPVINVAADLPSKAFRLTYISLHRNMQVTDEGLAAFKDCKNLTRLILSNTAVGDAGLAHFKDCKALTELELRGTQVTDAGLANFKDCKNLTAFALIGCEGISDAGLAHLKDCKRLQAFSLDGTNVTDAGLAHLGGCKGLTHLVVPGLPITDAGLAQFKDCKKLTHINLNQTRVTDAILTQLESYKKLTEVQLQKTKLTVAGIDKLKKALPQCKILWDGGVIEPTVSVDPDRRAAEYVLSIGGAVSIDGNDRGIQAKGDLPTGTFRLTSVGLHNNKQVTDAGLTVFESCTNVTNLDLGGTQVTDAGLAHFKNCKGMTGLWLMGVQVDGGLAAFKNSNLTEINLENTPVTDAGLAHLKDCKKLKTLSLLNTRVTDAGLAHLKDCKALAGLDLRGLSVTEAGLAHLKDCKDLTGFDMSSTNIKDGGLAIFKDFKNLTDLWLIGTSITDDGLSRLQDCKNLKYVNVRETKVSAAGIKTLNKAFPGCKIEWDGGAIEAKADPDRRAAEYVLSIGGTVCINGEDRGLRAVAELPRESFRVTHVDLGFNKQVTDAGLAAFDGCTNVTTISLYGCGQITDAGLAHFKECKGMTYLQLEYVRVTDAALAVFKNYKNLTFFNLGNTEVTDSGLAYLKDCKNLKVVALLNQPVTDAGLAHLKDCKQLTHLDLRNTRVTDAGLVFFKDCKDLTGLTLEDTAITNAGLALFKDCKNLTGLYLNSKAITNAGLAVLKDCKNLTDVSLSNTSITDAGLALFKDCNNLTILRLTGTGTTDAGLAHIKDSKNLQYINLQKTKVSAPGIDMLKQALPKWKIEWDGGVIEPKGTL